VDVGVAPDLVVANGGAHYQVPELKPGVFGAEFEAWLRASASALEHELMRDSRLVVTSSPANGFLPWEPQAAAYEVIRAWVAFGLRATHPAAFARTSYLDLHTLAGTDGCGLASRFPHYAYIVKERNACGRHYVPSDAHLENGAYLHLIEVAVQIGALGTEKEEVVEQQSLSSTRSSAGAAAGYSGAMRRCDPPPYAPPQDALAFREVLGSGPPGDNLAFRMSSMKNVLTGKTFNKAPPKEGRDQAFFDAMDHPPRAAVARRKWA